MKPVLKVARKETRPFKVPVLEFLLEESSDGNIDLIVSDGEYSETLLSIATDEVISNRSEKFCISRSRLTDLNKYFHLTEDCIISTHTEWIEMHEHEVSEATRSPIPGSSSKYVPKSRNNIAESACQFMDRAYDMYGDSMFAVLSELGKKDES